MKPILTTFVVAALGCLPLAAQTTETQKTTDVTRNPDGSVTKTETKTTTFDPEVRTKVVTYFDAYKTHPHGLPPAWATTVKVKEIPATWRTRIAPGLVISEKERPYLVAAPPDLVKVLPAPASGVRYYVAGSNVVAVDSSYRVVDSVEVPSIKIKVDD
jgi:hypothetical protein